MNKWLFGLGVLVPCLGFAATFPISGVDYNASTMTISATSAQHSPVTCLGMSVTPSHAFSLAELGVSDSSTSLTDFGDYDVDSCFQQAGDYIVKIDLYDAAGNYTDVPAINFTITSASPDETNSSLTADCTDAVANGVNSGSCLLSLSLKDEFGNAIEQAVSGQITSPAVSDTTDANLGVSFRNGLKIGSSDFKAANPVNFTWNWVSPASWAITALAPSIEKLNITEIPGTYASRLVDKIMGFTVDNLPTINSDGTIGSGIISFNNLPVSLRFNSPVEAEPSFYPKEFSWKDEININTNLVYPNAIGIAGNIAVALDSISEHLFSIPGDVDGEGNPIKAPITESFSFPNSASPSPESIQRELFAAGPYDTPADIALVTTASYNLGGQNIEFVSGAIGSPIQEAIDTNAVDPGSILGFNGESLSFKNIGVSIEGVVIGEETQMHLLGGDGGDDKITRIAAVHSSDIREGITQNAYELIRNAKVKITDPNDFDWTLFNNSNVVVVDLSGETNPENAVLNISGYLPLKKSTLIVLNGNVVIDGNVYYQNHADDSFGMILVRDEAGSYPERANVYVRPNVTNISGSIFVDGGFFSNDGNVLAEANTGNRTNQLVLIGSLLSRNTIGGSRLSENFTPWESTNDIDLASRYDLHEVRRYPGDGVNCAKPGGVCDVNTSAFVIRLDQKMSLLTPPGFSN